MGQFIDQGEVKKTLKFDWKYSGILNAQCNVIIKCDSGTDKKIATPISASQGNAVTPEKDKKLKQLEKEAETCRLSAKKTEESLAKAKEELQEIRRGSFRIEESSQQKINSLTQQVETREKEIEELADLLLKSNAKVEDLEAQIDEKESEIAQI